MKTGGIIKKLLIALGCLMLIAYLSYQIFESYYMPVQTETAHSYTVYDKVDTDVLAVRSESYVIEDKKGILVHAVQNSDKVAMGGKIAYLFEAQSDAEAFLRHDELDREIDYLKSLQLMSSGAYIVDPDTLDKRINNALYDTLDLISSGRLDNLEHTADELVDLINRRLVYTESLSGLSDMTRSLMAEKNALPPANELNYTTVRAEEPGYYVNTADGYETMTPYDTVTDLTPEDIDYLLDFNPSPIPENCIGKLIDKFQWYFICNANSAYCGELKIGDEVTVLLPLAETEQVSAKIRAINRLGDKTALILECTMMNGELAALRRETAQIRLKKYEGLRVSSKAIRREGDQVGVYALVGNVIKFRKINILYQSVDFAVVEQKDTSQWGNYDYLHLYDEVIVSGKNLFDGKIV